MTMMLLSMMTTMTTTMRLKSRNRISKRPGSAWRRSDAVLRLHVKRLVRCAANASSKERSAQPRSEKKESQFRKQSLQKRTAGIVLASWVLGFRLRLSWRCERPVTWAELTARQVTSLHTRNNYSSWKNSSWTKIALQMKKELTRRTLKRRGRCSDASVVCSAISSPNKCRNATVFWCTRQPTSIRMPAWSWGPCFRRFFSLR
mmetsp:Transcript_2950/g.4050  ORF Transcript_2950/g.4050 Transcript_2950/m.4050 type:complete len:203 (+) Transcript_2950:433-1041(+)